MGCVVGYKITELGIWEKFLRSVVMRTSRYGNPRFEGVVGCSLLHFGVGGLLLQCDRLKLARGAGGMAPDPWSLLPAPGTRETPRCHQINVN